MATGSTEPKKVPQLHPSNLLVLVALSLVVGIAPLFYQGGTFTWFVAAGISCSLPLLFWALVWNRRGIHHSHHQRVIPHLESTLPVLFFLIPLAVGLLQLIPLGSLCPRLSPLAAEIWADIPDCLPRLSIAPYAYWQWAGLLLSGLSLYLVSSNYSRHTPALKWMAIAMVVASLGNVLIGLCCHSDFSRGVFLNRNHNGLFIIMGIFMMFALILAAPSQSHQKYSCRQDIFVAFTLIVALFATLSRGAFVGFFSGLIALGGIALHRLYQKHHHHSSPQQEEKRSFQRRLLVGGVLLLGALFFTLPPILGKISSRFQEVMQEGLHADARVEIWKSSCELIGKCWLTGVGIGGYGDAVQRLNSVPLDSQRVAHAHNDYLELCTELGLPIALCLLLLFGYFLWRGWRRLNQQEDSSRFWFGSCALAAILGGLVQEFFDFNLQAGPNFLLFAVLLGIFQAAGRSIPTSAETPQKNHHSRWGIYLWAGVFALVLWGEARQLPAACYNDRLWNMMQPGYVTRGLGAPAIATKLSLAEKASRLAPNDPAVNLRLARLLYQSVFREKGLSLGDKRQRLVQAEHQLQAARTFAPSHSPVILWQGIVAETLNRGEFAMDFYRQLVKSAPTLLPYRQRYAEAALRFYRRRRRETARLEALDAYRGWIHRAPQIIRQQLPALMELQLNLEELLASSPLTPELLSPLFHALLQQRNFIGAEKLLQNYAQSYGTDSDPENRLVYDQCRLVLGRLQNGDNLPALRQQWILSLTAALDQRLRAFVEEQGGLEKVAIRKLQAYQQKEPVTHPETLLLLAQKYLDCGQTDEMTATLLPLTWTALIPPTEEQIQRALVILKTPKSIDRRMALAWRHLVAALPYLLKNHQEKFSAAPLSLLHPHLLLSKITISAPERMRMSSPVEASLSLQCLGHMNSRGKIVVSLSDSQGVFVQKAISFSALGKSPFRWQEGEVFQTACRFEIPLVRQIQAHGTPQGANRIVYLAVGVSTEDGASVSSLPPVILKAYEVPAGDALK